MDDDSDGEELPANFSLEVASDKSLLAAAEGKVMEIIDNEQRAVQLGDFKFSPWAQTKGTPQQLIWCRPAHRPRPQARKQEEGQPEGRPQTCQETYQARQETS